MNTQVFVTPDLKPFFAGFFLLLNCCVPLSSEQVTSQHLLSQSSFHEHLGELGKGVERGPWKVAGFGQ